MFGGVLVLEGGRVVGWTRPLAGQRIEGVWGWVGQPLLVSSVDLDG